jgi:uncharacterized protein
MAILPSSFPGAPRRLFNGHLETLSAGIFRRVHGVQYTRERINTPDGDFLDLDWIRRGNKRLLILTHGLEGNSDRQYMRGAAKLFSQNGWDVLAWNCRSCSGEMNRAFRLYHHGDIHDIGTVVQHASTLSGYEKIALVGFSMGANITMKYLGIHGEKTPPQVRVAVTFSAPCDLEAGAYVLDRWDNTLYRKRFMRSLVQKLRTKDAQFPGRLDLSKLRNIKQWRDFDEWFSAPICGYRDAAEFYRNSSSKYFVDGIRRPTLLISAKNDPILTPGCFPVEIAREHPYFHLELTEQGGHCAFRAHNDGEFAWSERRALAFCGEYC